LDDVVVTATLRWSGGQHRWRFQGSVGPDDCVLVGTVSVVVPDAVGSLVLDLTLEHPEAAVTNRYRSEVVAPSATTSR
jgi:hypothetical protein